MGFFVKRLVFYGFLSVFISFSFSNCFDPPENIGETSYTNVEYSEDGKSITMYLDGSAPVPANRSLSNPLARLGHDFFEVTFLYNTDNNSDHYIIARAAWELGEPAGVNGVYRGQTVVGVNYYGTNPVGIPAAGQGSAVLFVGRRTDKTLLAVGTLSHIDDIPVTTNPNITQDTKKVSFAVNALKAGVNENYSSASNSFKITSPSQAVSQGKDGILEYIKVGGEMFPFFLLPIEVDATATYTVGVSYNESSSPYSSFSFYAPAIIYAGGAEAHNVRPHYTLPPSPLYNTVQSTAKYDWAENDEKVNVSIISPTDGDEGSPFSGTVDFSINTMNVDVDSAAIFSLTFEIPVYAVSASPDSAGNAPVQWMIRPGYNEYYRDLDNGTLRSGGAVLIGIGKIVGGKAGLILIGEPIKYNNVTSDGLKFTLKGIEIWFNDGDSSTNLTNPINNPNYPNNFESFSNLTFYYNTSPFPDFDPANPVNPGTRLYQTTDLPFGRVLIRVKYDPGGGTVYWLSFIVEVFDIGVNVEIPYANRVFIAKQDDFQELANNIYSPGNYLFVFSTDIDITGMTFNFDPGAVTIYIISTVEGITLGRAGDIVFLGNGPVVINLGKWPFNEPAFAGGNIVTSEDFYIHSRGSWNSNSTTYLVDDYWFTHPTGGGNGTGTVTVKQFPGVTIDYPETIPVTP